MLFKSDLNERFISSACRKIKLNGFLKFPDYGISALNIKITTDLCSNVNSKHVFSNFAKWSLNWSFFFNFRVFRGEWINMIFSFVWSSVLYDDFITKISTFVLKVRSIFGRCFVNNSSRNLVVAVWKDGLKFCSSTNRRRKQIIRTLQRCRKPEVTPNWNLKTPWHN